MYGGSFYSPKSLHDIKGCTSALILSAVEFAAAANTHPLALTQVSPLNSCNGERFRDIKCSLVQSSPWGPVES
jgi:hypothetical protein